MRSTQYYLLIDTLLKVVSTQFAFPLAVSGSFHSLFKVLLNFPSRYLFAIGLMVIFSLR